MKTTLLIAASLLALSTFGCASSTEGPDEPVVAKTDTTESTTPRMINQGGCTPEQLAMGAWEVHGICFGGGGSSSGGGGGVGACQSRCDTSSSRCEATCEARGGLAACFESCYRLEGLCYQGCH